MSILIYTHTDLFRAIGLAMLHSVWQGTIILIIVLSILGLVGKTNARLRYAMLYGSLMLFLFAFILTFILVFRHGNAGALSQPITNPASQQVDILTHQPPGGKVLDFSPVILFNALEPVYPSLALAWMLGFILLGIRLAGGIYLSRKIIKQSAHQSDTRLQRIFNRLRDSLHCKRKVHLLVTVRKISPMVIGVFKPAVILPATIISGLSPDQIESILAHELAHIKRYDHILLILQVFAAQFLFFHPVSWYLVSEINRERENCCDDLVIQSGIDPLNYIKALTMIQEMNYSGMIPANALAGRSKSLLARIIRLVRPESQSAPHIRLALVLLFMLFIGIAVAGTLHQYSRNGIQFSAPVLLSHSGLKAQALPDTSKNFMLTGTVKTRVTDKKDRKEKDIKIVFSNDSVKELSVDGAVVPPSEMKNYDETIQQVKKDMEKSQSQLEAAEIELDRAKDELAKAKIHMADVDWGNIMGNVDQAMHEAYLRMEEYRLEHGDEIRQQMDMAREQIRMAMEQFRSEDMQKIREEMQRAREEMERAREEFRQKHPGDADFEFAPLPPMLPGEFPELPPIPPLDSTLVIPPFPPFPPMPPDSLTHEKKQVDSKQMESTLKELEKK